MQVIGTAGHIDHGKSTLVRTLTGVDPDRLAEEKRRGMTIELGFAELVLPSGRSTGVVDVPGHERFVRTMLAGAGGIDVALVVIAADEGVMPQTREHLYILDLLGIRSCVVALTKADTVDAEWLELVTAEVADFVAGTALRDSPIVQVSAVSGHGLPQLLTALDAALDRLPPRLPKHSPFLPVDRVFTLAGFGTVVTGTLHGGELHSGSEVVLLPSNRRSRIRSAQSHRRSVEIAVRGSRAALNLAGVTVDEIRRGEVVTLPDAYRVTRRFDGSIRTLPASPTLEHGMQLAVHIGSGERSGTLSLLGTDRLGPGQEGWAQIRLDQPVPGIAGQRFILRLPSPVGTVAGGAVVDIAPRHRRHDATALNRLAAMASADDGLRLEALLSDGRARSEASIGQMLGIPLARARTLLGAAVTAGKAVERGRAYVNPAAWAAFEQRAAELLAAYHASHPTKRGMPREELRRKLRVMPGDWTDVSRRLQKRGVLVEDDALVAAPGHRGGTAGRERDAERVLDLLRANPGMPPPAQELLATPGVDETLLRALREEGRIVRCTEAVYFERQAYERMAQEVLAMIDRQGAVTVAEARDALGITRKYALALLEQFDADRITRRQGEARVRGSRRPACA